jgi:outer membrane protein
MQAELDSMGQEYNEDSLKMSAELKKAKETDIIEMQQAMQNYSLVFNNELTKREQQLEYELVQKYKKAVDSVATKQGYTIVIDGSAATLYVNPKLNITDDVLYELRKLNEENSSTE